MADEVGLKVTLDGKEVITESKKVSKALSSNFKIATQAATKGVRKLNDSIFSLKGAVAAAGVGFATKQIADLGKELIGAASDAEETANKFSVVFQGLGDEASEATERIRKGFGLANEESQRLLSNTADILVGFGFTRDAALKLSESTQTLAGDLASFNNLQTSDASERLTKALTGETESLKALGIVIRQDTKEYKNLVASIQQTEQVSLLQAKALANIQIATEQSTNAIGDFSRSMNSFANQSRIANARLQDVRVELGQALLPVANEVLQNTIIPLMGDLSETIIDNKDEIQNFVETGVKGLSALKVPAELLLSVLAKTAEGYSKIAQIVEAGSIQAEQQERVKESFDRTNKTVNDYAVILTDIERRLEALKKLDPNAGNLIVISKLNEEYEQYTELLNKAQSERVKSGKAAKDEAGEIDKNTESTNKNAAASENLIKSGTLLSKLNNDYIDSLDREFEQFQLLKQVTEDALNSSLEGRALSIAQIEQETAELKTQAALKIQDKEILEQTFTAIEQTEANKRAKIRESFDNLDKQLAKNQKSRNLDTYSSIANNAIRSFSAIFGEHKLFASTTAGIDGAVAVQKALATPPPLNIPLAISTSALAATNVAQINGLNLAQGTEFVGGAGSGVSDSVPANLSVTERVVPGVENARLNGIRNDELADAVGGRDGLGLIGIVGSIFTQEEIAQRLIDIGAIGESAGLTAI